MPPPLEGRPPAKFVTGSLLRHILVMTGTGAIGLSAIFLGDLANILFLSWLKDEAVVAAVGYASSILFFTISTGIGLSIAATALVAPRLGAGERVVARRLSVNAHVASFLISLATALLIWLVVPRLLALLGATGRTLELASGYLAIIIPSLPFLATAMTSAAVLRSVGDARRAMNITLAIAIVNSLLDPIFILVLGLGIDGAAMASTIARAAAMGIGLYGVIKVHDLLGPFRWHRLVSDTPALMAIAVPAILTNIASPISNAYVTAAISHFGDSAVAGWAVIGRVLPVAFGAIYALSGSIGPIIGQNFGAGDPVRLKRAFTLSLWVNAGFTAAAWLGLAIFANPIADLFHASGDARELIVLYCRWLSPLFVFMGSLFVANAAFNTLGRAQVSTALNWGRATLGTVPVVQAGASIAGAAGVLWGYMLGGVLFGVVAVWVAYAVLARLEREIIGSQTDKS